MARIRTIKPEFWTDEIVVQLPFHARLLFIGIWNFADDHGAIEESPDRLRMQVFPSDHSLDVGELLDLLVTANLLERFQNDEGKRVVQVRNWHKHQKVDNPAKSRILGESYRKLAIPNEARKAVAIKYGCKPGETKQAECYFCGSPGSVHWWKRHDGKPSGWVVFPDLELDHIEPEFTGGANSAENIVLSCRSCNRGRRDKAALPWIASKAFATPIESSPSEGIKDQGSRIKDQGRDQGPTDRAAEQPRVRSKAGKDSTAEPPEFAEIRKAYPRRAGSQRWGDAVKHYRERIAEGVTHDAILAGVTRYARFLEATGKAGTETVQQAATFLGDNRGYLEPWNAPTQTQQPRPLSTVERVRQANGVHRDDRVVAEQRNGSSFDDLDLLGGDVRQPLHAGIRRLGS